MAPRELPLWFLPPGHCGGVTTQLGWAGAVTRLCLLLHTKKEKFVVLCNGCWSGDVPAEQTRVLGLQGPLPCRRELTALCCDHSTSLLHVPREDPSALGQVSPPPPSR